MLILAALLMISSLGQWFAQPLKHYSSRTSRLPLFAASTCLLTLAPLSTRAAKDVCFAREMKVATWNVAAINNNPFEYWITYDGQHYNKMMEDVQNFILSPGEKDVKVSQVLTEEMFQELVVKMKEQKWEGVEETQKFWTEDFKERKIISGFIKDNVLGQKRLASMPDRVTNTINTATGTVYRPTPINCYPKTFESFPDWWEQWKEFMFDKPIAKTTKTGDVVETNVASMLLPIKRAKYPALTEDEERVSIPLSTMCAAIFDAILVHMLNQVAADVWQPLRQEMCSALNMKKNERTLDILKKQYGDIDILFLQEVANSFSSLVRADTELASKYEVIAPNTSGKRDQNSVVLLAKDKFDCQSVADVTADVQGKFEENTPVAEGDLLTFTVKSKDEACVTEDVGHYVLASFHGDTNGLATVPVVKAVHEYVSEKFEKGGSNLIFGLDANTYEKGKPGKKQDVTEFVNFLTTLKMNSCWGTEARPKEYTTFNARTFLQPQLNKACTKEQFLELGDVNPKDFILFYDDDFQVQSNEVRR